MAPGYADISARPKRSAAPVDYTDALKQAKRSPAGKRGASKSQRAEQGKSSGTASPEPTGKKTAARKPRKNSVTAKKSASRVERTKSAAARRAEHVTAEDVYADQNTASQGERQEPSITHKDLVQPADKDSGSQKRKLGERELERGSSPSNGSSAFLCMSNARKTLDHQGCTVH